MRCLLIWPAFENLSQLDITWIPHGIGHLATEAIAKGLKVDVVDGRTIPLNTLKRAIATETDITHIGISIISVYSDYADELINFTKQTRPDVSIIVGGIHPSIFPEKYDGVDWIVIGEGEKVFPEILANERPTSTSVIEGRIDNLDELLPVDRSLFYPVKERPIAEGMPTPFATIFSSRGCPYQCTFCQPAEKNIFGPKLKVRSVDKVVNEITSLNLKSFYMHDDCFIAMPNYVKEFCNLIAPLNLKWWCQGRSDLIVRNMNLIYTMREAGLVGMIIGHESGDDEMLKKIKKGTTVKQNVESVALLKALGIDVISNIIIGFPDEKPSQVMNTLGMVAAMKPKYITVCPYTPHPGSYLYQECVERDLIPEDIKQGYFNRGNFEPKIKGQDYTFLNWAREQMLKATYGG